jgi:hypothetical protein
MSLPFSFFVRTLFRTLAAAGAALALTASAFAAACQAQSGAEVPTELELYTSEGCSSCPPTDKSLSGLQRLAAQGRVVPQAFHVGYWDYIGWVDRFAAPAYTNRQKQLAQRNHLSGIYTPQLVRNGQDWRDYADAATRAAPPAQARIALERTQADAFEATVTPADAGGAWSAYWTVTENGHASKVKAGENAGESLQHDFVVRQYVPAGQYKGTQKLSLRAVPADAAHPRQVNLVVFDPKSGKPLQALSLACS